MANELKVEQVKAALAAFNGGVVRVEDLSNPRGYVDYYRPREAMAKALRIASEKPRTPVSVGESELRNQIEWLVGCAANGDNPAVVANQIAALFLQLEAEKAELPEKIEAAVRALGMKAAFAVGLSSVAFIEPEDREASDFVSEVSSEIARRLTNKDSADVG